MSLVSERQRLWRGWHSVSVRGDVPEGLKEGKKKIFALDMGGRLWRGQNIAENLKERLKAVLEEVRTSEGRIILFIDELHLIVEQARQKVRWMQAIC